MSLTEDQIKQIIQEELEEGWFFRDKEEKVSTDVSV